MTDATEVVRFKDFSVSPEPIAFQMEDDTFHCLPDISLDLLMELADFATIGEQQGRGAQIEKMKEFFDGILDEDSAGRLRERTKKGATQPIGKRLLVDVMPWLMEVYGLRPTQPSSESAAGSDDTDISSTAGASPEE